MDFGLKYLTPLVYFFFSPFNLLASSVSVEGCKGIIEGKKTKKDTKIGDTFKFQLYFGFHTVTL